MKVLMVAPGDSIHSKRVLGWLLGGGCQVVYVNHEDPRPEGGGAYRFVRYPVPRGTRYYGRLLRNRGAGELARWTVAAQLRLLWVLTRPDVAHIHFVDLRAYDCVRSGIRPLVLSVWGTDVNRHLYEAEDRVGRDMAARALAGADLLLVDAQDMPGKCRALAGTDVRTELLPLGIDTGRFRPGYAEEAAAWRRRLTVPEGGALVLSARAWHARYGHDLILEGFARAARRLRRPAVLVFKRYNTTGAEETASFERALRQRGDELGISGLLRWLDDIPYGDLPGLYAASDVVVNFPRIDAFPVTFLEAAACERPLVTVRLPSYEGTLAEKYFTMVEPGDVAGLAAALEAAVEEPAASRAARLAEARSVVQREYDESVSSRRLLAIYRELSRSSKGSSATL